MNGSQQLLSSIFTDSQGHPLRIYVEPSSIQDRLNLLRSLRSHGAQIARYPEEAHIILVDETIQDSLDLAAQWPEVLTLSYIWAHQAVREGRYRGADEDWGGRRVRVDASGSQETNALPTPRQTPISEGRSAALPSGIPIPSSQVSFQQASGSPGPFQSQMQTLSYATQPLPHTATPINPNVTTSYPMQTTAPNLPTAAPNPVLQTLLDLLRQGTANPLVASLAQQVQNPLQQFAATYPGQVPSNSMVEFSVSNYQSLPSQPLAQDDPQAVSSVSRHPSQSSEPDFYRQSGRSKRKSSHQDELPRPSDSYRGKGKARADIRERPQKQHRQSITSGRESSRKNRSASRSEVESSDEDDRIFVKKNGDFVKFKVDMQVRNRRELLPEIKKHGGMVVMEMSEADYVVLAAHADNFESELRQTIALDRPAVKADFVYECVKEGIILDEEEFSFDGVIVRGKRGKPNREIDLAAMREAQQMSKVDSRRSRSTETPVKDKQRKVSKKTNKSQTEDDEAPYATPVRRGRGESSWSAGRKPAKAGNSKGSMQLPQAEVEVEMDVDPVHDRTSRSPSPIPPANIKIVEFTHGRNRYTQEDLEYFTTYVAHLLRGDPDMQVGPIAAKLYSKMPHHPEGSWQSYCTRPTGSEIIMQARKKAFIMLRKKREMQQHFVQDLDTIVTYLSSGVPDNVSDDQALAELARQHPCRSAASWEQFWDNHHETITAKLQEQG